MRYRTKQIVLILVTCVAIIGLISACNSLSGPVATQEPGRGEAVPSVASQFSNAPSAASEQAGSSCCGSAAPTKITASGCGCGATGSTNPSVPARSGCGCAQ